MKKKFIVATAAVVLLLTFGLCACKSAPVNGEYDINAGVTGTRGNIQFTVVSYNLHSGGATEDMVKGICAQIDAEGADIAGLQEVDSNESDRAGGNMITNLTSGAMKEYFFAPTMSYYFGKDYGIMTTSKHKMDTSFSLYLPFPYEHMTVSNAAVEPRVVTRSLITIDGVQVAAYNTHLDYTDATMPDGTLLRLAQMQFVYELMLSDPCPYQVLTGDFNAGGWDDFAVFSESDEYALANNAENPIPADMVTASGSGLDPHITLAAAKFQMPRVAKARGMSEAELRKIIDSQVEYPGGIMRNEPIVNVLMLNLALDQYK